MLDLNLLPVLRALHEEKSVTGAAKRLGLTQPAVSNALARLRVELDDPLFVRVPGGMAATERAREILDEVTVVLDRLERALGSRTFSPAATRTRFQVATTDFFEHRFLSRVIVALGDIAPNAQIVSHPLDAGRLPREELERGEIHLAIAGFFGELPPSFYAKPLIQETYATLVRTKHRALKKGALTREAFLNARHLLVSPQGDLHGAVDRALAAHGASRVVVAGLQSFLAAGFVVAESDLVLTAPRRLCQWFAEHANVVMVEPPISLPSFRLVATWHARTHEDPAQKWFRDRVIEACLDGGKRRRQPSRGGVEIGFGPYDATLR